MQALQDSGIEHLQVLPHMLSHIRQRDVCDVFAERTWLGSCWGHYNPEGEKVIAALVTERLRQLAADAN